MRHHRREFAAILRANSSIKSCHAQRSTLNASGLHYVVLDEVDNLTLPAQRSLKSVMNTERAIFILTNNYLNTIDMGVVNRCILVELNAASHQQLGRHIHRVTADMNVVLNDEEITEIIAAARGSVRDATHDAIRRANRQLRGIRMLDSQQAA